MAFNNYEHEQEIGLKETPYHMHIRYMEIKFSSHKKDWTRNYGTHYPLSGINTSTHGAQSYSSPLAP